MINPYNFHGRAYCEADDPMIGRRFGELRVVSCLGIVGRGRRYLCDCDCGTQAIRLGSYLRAAELRGTKSCCRACMNELRSGMYAERLKAVHLRIMGYLESFGTLYPPWWEEQIGEAIMQDLSAAFGDPVKKEDDFTASHSLAELSGTPGPGVDSANPEKDAYERENAPRISYERWERMQKRKDLDRLRKSGVPKVRLLW